jgi:alpha-amylase
MRELTSICLTFEVHQPYRLKHYPNNGFMIPNKDIFNHFFDHGLDKFVFQRAANKCYYPTLDILQKHVDMFKNEKRKFKFALNLSGTWVEQAQMWAPELIDRLKELSKSKCVEFLGSTYYHSLSSLFDRKKVEFKEQVKMQGKMIRDLFRKRPNVFLNTEMVFDNAIGDVVSDMRFKGIFTEGIDRILGWRSPNHVYESIMNTKIKILLRNYRLSDDVGYRFSSKEWNEWPLTAEKYAYWLSSTTGDVINIAMDFETFGEHHWSDTGIFWFLNALPWKIFDHGHLEFHTPSEVLKKYPSVGSIDVPEGNAVSWADLERDTSAWLGNRMQQIGFEDLKGLEHLVKESNNKELLKFWRMLQISDHLYYACTKWWGDGDVHNYFSVFDTPHDGFINLFRATSDLKNRLLGRKIVSN